MAPRRSKRLLAKAENPPEEDLLVEDSLPKCHNTSFGLFPDEVALLVLESIENVETVLPLLTVSRRLFNLVIPLLWKRLHGCEHFMARITPSLKSAPTKRSGGLVAEDASADKMRAAFYAKSIKSFCFMWDAQRGEGDDRAPLAVKDLFAVVSRATEITRFELSGQGDTFLNRVSNLISQNLGNVTRFSLVNHSFEHCRSSMLADMLSSMPNLKKLSLSSIVLHKDSLAKVAEIEMPELAEVRIQKCYDDVGTSNDNAFVRMTEFHINDAGLNAFLAKFAGGQLTDLVLENCREHPGWWGLSSESIGLIARAVEETGASRMKHLGIDVGPLSKAEDVLSLSTALGTTIQDLSLSFRHNISGELFTQIYTSLATENTALESLHILGWYITDLATLPILTLLHSFPNLIATSLCTYPPLFSVAELRTLQPLVDRGLKYLAISGFTEFANSLEFEELKEEWGDGERQGCFLRCRVVEDARTALLGAFMEFIEGLGDGAEEWAEGFAAGAGLGIGDEDE